MRPPDSLPIKRVRQRYYLGYCRERSYLDDAIAHFNDRRAAIEGVVAESELINDRTRQRTLKYIGAFYDMLGSPKRVERDIVGKCRGTMPGA